MKPSEAFRLLPRRARIRALRLARASQVRVWEAEAEVLRTIALAKHDHKTVETADAWIADLRAAQLRSVSG